MENTFQRYELEAADFKEEAEMRQRMPNKRKGVEKELGCWVGDPV